MYYMGSKTHFSQTNVNPNFQDIGIISGQIMVKYKISLQIGGRHTLQFREDIKHVSPPN